MKISFEQATRMKYKHIKLEGASQEVKAMDSIQDSLGAIELSTVFGYTRFYVGWETNKVFFSFSPRRCCAITLIQEL